MISKLAEQIRSKLQPDVLDDTPIVLKREQWEKSTREIPTAPGVSVENVEVGGIRCLLCTPVLQTSDKVIVYCHGGGLVEGSAETSRVWTSRIAAHVGRRVISIDYRLAPEHPFPAAIHDVLAVCRGLQTGIDYPSDFCIGADSSGCNLALVVLVKLGGDENWKSSDATGFGKKLADRDVPRLSQKLERGVGPRVEEKQEVGETPRVDKNLGDDDECRASHELERGVEPSAEEKQEEGEELRAGEILGDNDECRVVSRLDRSEVSRDDYLQVSIEASGMHNNLVVEKYSSSKNNSQRKALQGMPRCAFFLSPSIDLTFSGKSIVHNAAIDPLVSKNVLEHCAKLYVGDHDRSHPDVSPLFANLVNVSPTLVMVDEYEILLSDSTRLVDKMIHAGGCATLHTSQSLWHVWPTWGEFPEAAYALDLIRDHIETHS